MNDCHKCDHQGPCLKQQRIPRFDAESKADCILATIKAMNMILIVAQPIWLLMLTCFYFELLLDKFCALICTLIYLLCSVGDPNMTGARTKPECSADNNSFAMQ